MKLTGINRLPIFRSEVQAAVLAELFVHAHEPLSLTDLAARTGYSTAAVHKDIERLEAAGLVTSERRGRSRLVRPDETTPFYSDLRSLLTRAFGPTDLLREALGNAPNIDRAFIYGSWARSDHGAVGQPNDIDVMVIGTPDVADLYERMRAVESAVGRPINLTILTESEWNESETGFLKRVRESPTVPLL